MLPPSPSNQAADRRFLTDRRRGLDRRSGRRRVRFLPIPAERRQAVDRRDYIERRSTLERRGGAGRRSAAESAAEHVRNAVQVLAGLARSGVEAAEVRAGIDVAIRRLGLAIQELERSNFRA